MSKHEPGITPMPNGKFRAEAYDKVTKRRVYRTFDTKTAARNWRRDQQVKLATGEARALPPKLLSHLWLDWLIAAQEGLVRNRSGKEYKPSVLRGYSDSFRNYWLPKLGHMKVAEIRTKHIQDLVREMIAAGLAAQTIRNRVLALRVLMKWAIQEELVARNPCDDLSLPSGGETRDRIASPSEALLLVQALPTKEDRALWATAFFAGLRRGELAALRWEDVDLVNQTIAVRRSWDFASYQFIEPKTKKATRVVGIPALLVPFLAALDGTEGLVWTNGSGNPFRPAETSKRAEQAWADAGLKRITLHECRHTYASVMIAAGVNIKTISEWMGHSSVTITLDRYGHLLPGSAAVALGLLDEFLAKEIA